MTKAQALYQFFSSFGLNAYPSTSIPDDVAFPYLVYEPAISNRGGSSSPTVSIYDYSDGEASINAYADNISKAIAGGKSIVCDDGVIYAYFDGSWNPLTNENDSAIKGRSTNMLLIFNTL